MSEDTEILLAMLSSLLTEPVLDQSTLLEALAENDGNAERAASSLNLRSSTTSSSNKKRKTVGDLDEWLQPSLSKPTKSAKASTRQTLDRARHEPDSAIKSTSENPLRSHQANRASSSKPVVNLMSVLRQPQTTTREVSRLPPLTLTNPDMIARHTPCTLHSSALPPELACRLFYAMLDEAKGWQRNKWWLFERLVESPHRTGFYVRTEANSGDETAWQQAAQFWYNGKPSKAPPVFPSPMEEAARIIERIVNDDLRKRTRFALEWGGGIPGAQDEFWQANVAASNCYEGTKESVGFHSDRLNYIGPYPTIASLSLGTSRIFRLREVIPTDEKGERQARTYNIPLPHNSLIIMHGSTQEKFKHCVPPQPTIDLFRPSHPRAPDVPIEPSNCRINITYRFFRPDFHPNTIPRCKCDIPAVLSPDMKMGAKGEDGCYRYWWHCNAAPVNEGKDCGFWQAMDMKAEGRGPCLGGATVDTKK